MVRFQVSLPLAAALLLNGAALSPLHAQERETRSTVVDYSDLNLASASGQSALRHRLVVASRHVCGEADGRELSVTADVVACRDAARTAAMRQFDRVLAATSPSQHVVQLATSAPN